MAFLTGHILEIVNLIQPPELNYRDGCHPKENLIFFLCFGGKVRIRRKLFLRRKKKGVCSQKPLTYGTVIWELIGNFMDP